MPTLLCDCQSFIKESYLLTYLLTCWLRENLLDLLEFSEIFQKYFRTFDNYPAVTGWMCWTCVLVDGCVTCHVTVAKVKLNENCLFADDQCEDVNARCRGVGLPCLCTGSYVRVGDRCCMLITLINSKQYTYFSVCTGM